MVLREAPNVWKYGPLPRCTQTLMSLAPVEAKAAGQTHHPLKAYLVPSKKMLPIDKRIRSSVCTTELLPSVSRFLPPHWPQRHITKCYILLTPSRNTLPPSPER